MPDTDQDLVNLKAIDRLAKEIHASMEEIANQVKSSSKEDIDTVTANAQLAQNLLAQFNAHVKEFHTNNELLHTSGKSSERFKMSIQSHVVNSLYVSIQARLITLTKEQPAANPNDTTVASPSQANPVLSKIPISKFSGNILEWSEFISTFDSLVHNNARFDPVHKFHYLKTALSNEAARVVENFQLTSANYEIAYRALKLRYDNPRRIANVHVQKILDFKPLTSGSVSSLKSFLDTHQNSILALKALSLDDLSDFILLSLALRNLDARTRKVFEEQQKPNIIPKYQELFDFTLHQIHSAELATDSAPTLAKSKIQALHVQTNSAKVQSSRPKSPSSNKSKLASTCTYCKYPHQIFSCNKFTVLPLVDKYQFLTNNRRCFSCLGPHLRVHCPSKATCRNCGSKAHNTLLHPPSDEKSVATSADGPRQPSGPRPVTSAPPAAEASPVTLSCTSKSMPVANTNVSLLGTFTAHVCDSFGQLTTVRGVVDPGSQVSFINLSLAKQLCLPYRKHSAAIHGISQTSSRTLGITSCQLFSTLDKSKVDVRLLVLDKISSPIPSVPLDSSLLELTRNLDLADPSFLQPGEIDILLGADAYPQIILDEKPLRLAAPGPVAIKTIFGWTVVGPTSHHNTPMPNISLLAASSISEELTRFWELEQVKSVKSVDPMDHTAEQHFVQTHSRQTDGRYVVALPFHPNAQTLDSNRRAARASLLNLEKRLLKQPSLITDYHDFMQEYADAHHMSPAHTSSSYIIPHHIVTKETNQGPKIRVVFNASSKDAHGYSLNTQLLKGPKLQQDIVDVLLCFRLDKVALCCDIRQMYRQILVAPGDRKFQHIFWRPDTNGEIQEAELNTVTYGLAPSAFLAVRVLHQLVADEGHNYPAAAQALLHQTYVDDIITGASDISSAKELQFQLSKLLALGGFELRKWCSSHPSVLTHVNDEHKEAPLILSDTEQSLKILGLNWDPVSDVFNFRTRPFNDVCTKRSMLSFIAQIFDPVGYLAPFVFSLKLFIQKLWLLKLDWDQEVPPSIAERWSDAIITLPALKDLAIPRCALPEARIQRFYLVGFCDASESGYAAVVYLTFDCEGHRYSTLWKAKTRVAPLKTLSIPRLELCAAVLLADLVQSVSAIQYPRTIDAIKVLSDSQVVLSWLLTPPHKLKTFVANRVTHITQTLATDARWSHIGTQDNPADMASRGVDPSQLLTPRSYTLWFQGPSFLHDATLPWPPTFTLSRCTSSLPEQKVDSLALVSTQLDDSFLHTLLAHSSMLRCQRVVAWCRRFISNCKSKRKALPLQSSPLTVVELESALEIICKIDQKIHFAKELHEINNGKPSVKLACLSPFVDSAGLLRVGGRLANAAIDYQARHPILLAKDSRLSHLICTYYHATSMHSGPIACQALIRSRFWILSLRSIIRKVIHSCLICHKFKAITMQNKMADLPSCRVTAARPFLTTGVDYAGPFQIRASPLRKSVVTKGYLCLFVCAATKAVHLELSSDLSTDAFLGCFDRFVARRGLPHTIMSDRGTNFVGAKKRLEELFTFLERENDTVQNYLSKQHIQWELNPPYAPNFGGLWEAAVKSTKRLLYRMTTDVIFTFEEFSTIFCRIEAVLNSRPLCGLSSDPSESADYLSPGHFLIGAPLLARPEAPVQHKSLARHWEAISQITTSFWHRWSKEYLNTLTQRPKWTKPIKVQEGDVVFIKGLTNNPLQWPIARIVALHPGKDSLPRVASLRTACGPVLRPINKLIRLPD